MKPSDFDALVLFGLFFMAFAGSIFLGYCAIVAWNAVSFYESGYSMYESIKLSMEKFS